MRDSVAPWPRRLVICLPMRTLVEQTEAAALTWLTTLRLTDTASVHLLMGGGDRAAMRDWDLHPERPAIPIATQDMLLNCGYGPALIFHERHYSL